MDPATHISAGFLWRAYSLIAVDAAAACLPWRFDAPAVVDARPASKSTAPARLCLCPGTPVHHVWPNFDPCSAWPRLIFASACRAAVHGGCQPLALRAQASPVPPIRRGAADMDRNLEKLQ